MNTHSKSNDLNASHFSLQDGRTRFPNNSQVSACAYRNLIFFAFVEMCSLHSTCFSIIRIWFHIYKSVLNAQCSVHYCFWDVHLKEHFALTLYFLFYFEYCQYAFSCVIVNHDYFSSFSFAYWQFMMIDELCYGYLNNEKYWLDSFR